MAVKLGFVGAGGRTVRELLDLVQVPDADITALCDIDLARCELAVQRVRERTGQGTDDQAKQRAQALQPAVYPDVQRMLDGSELDAVYVSLPPFAHGEIEHAVVDAGKAIFVEKPVAITMTEAREIDAHIKQKGVISCVGYQSRYSTAVQAARERLSGVPIGLVIAIRLGGLPGTAWWKVQNKSGGMLIEQHTHGVDLMRYLAGEVESVFAFANTALLTDVPTSTSPTSMRRPSSSPMGPSVRSSTPARSNQGRARPRTYPAPSTSWARGSRRWWAPVGRHFCSPAASTRKSRAKVTPTWR